MLCKIYTIKKSALCILRFSTDLIDIRHWIRKQTCGLLFVLVCSIVVLQMQINNANSGVLCRLWKNCWATSPMLQEYSAAWSGQPMWMKGPLLCVANKGRTAAYKVFGCSVPWKGKNEGPYWHDGCGHEHKLLVAMKCSTEGLYVETDTDVLSMATSHSLSLRTTLESAC